ncbi:MAG: allantoate deiminase [Oscillospiraceae bacterium]|nr:allantoate deiminase [Oscillospiraceae bacterium]
MSEDLQKNIVGLLDTIAEKAIDPAGGVTRLLYTKEWSDTQRELKQLMESAGLETYFDDIGNLFGRLSGSKWKNETLLTGSHVDSVRNGGKYDGIYGIIAGLFAIRHLKEKYGAPLRNIELVSFAEEEGSRFPFAFWGSKNFLGLAKKENVAALQDSGGCCFIDAMEKAGFGFQENNVELRPDVKCFFEVHIEQGGILERELKDIGIVNGIVGQQRFDIDLKNIANHAGTTPMAYRQDTLYAASKMISTIIDRAKEYGDPLVATVGFIEAKPNSCNVIPGNTRFSLDIRHTDNNFLNEFSDESAEKMRKIARECGVEIEIHMWMDVAPVPMNTELVHRLEDACRNLNYSYKIMHSGAGHDAQIIAPYIPSAMLFVPSKNGVSHSPQEFTEPKCLEMGVHVLSDVLYQLAYH